jgi:hypothetical protein
LEGDRLDSEVDLFKCTSLFTGVVDFTKLTHFFTSDFSRRLGAHRFASLEDCHRIIEASPNLEHAEIRGLPTHVCNVLRAVLTGSDSAGEPRTICHNPSLKSLHVRLDDSVQPQDQIDVEREMVNMIVARWKIHAVPFDYIEVNFGSEDFHRWLKGAARGVRTGVSAFEVSMNSSVLIRPLS